MESVKYLKYQKFIQDRWLRAFVKEVTRYKSGYSRTTADIVAYRKQSYKGTITSLGTGF
jgi:hypothetical protein